MGINHSTETVGCRANFFCERHQEDFKNYCPKCFPKMEDLLEKKVVKSGVPWPIYFITDVENSIVVICHWQNGATTGAGNIRELYQMHIDGALEFVSDFTETKCACGHIFSFKRNKDKPAKEIVKCQKCGATIIVHI